MSQFLFSFIGMLQGGKLRDVPKFTAAPQSNVGASFRINFMHILRLSLFFVNPCISFIEKT